MSSVRDPSPTPHAEPARAHYVRPRKKTTAPGAQALAELRRLATQAQAQGRDLLPNLQRPSRPEVLTGQTLPQQVAQGLLQPFYAAGLLFRHRDLLAQALVPALLLLAFCLGVGFFKALVDDQPGVLWPMLRSALASFVVLAPVPSIIMANHYGRLCAQAHERMQLGPCRPRRLPLVRAALLALRQLVVVSVVLLPLSLTVHLVPWVGEWTAQALLLLWALHWIVVEALDDGCVDAAPESHQEAAPPPGGTWLPWFLSPLQRVGVFFSGWLGAPLRWFVRRASWLCAPWRKEILLVEQNLPVMLGFAATTAALLCTPGLNLVFRPITVVAAVRLIGRLRGLVPPLAPETVPKTAPKTAPETAPAAPLAATPGAEPV